MNDSNGGFFGSRGHSQTSERSSSSFNTTSSLRSSKSSSPKYWTLGGLGPSRVDTPDWKVRRERWLRQKKFGTDASNANRSRSDVDERDRENYVVRKEIEHINEVIDVERNDEDEKSELSRRLHEVAESNNQESGLVQEALRRIELRDIAKLARLM